MRPSAVVLTLLRFCPGDFIRNTAYAVVNYTIAPLILGLATQTFFDGAGKGMTATVWISVTVFAGVQLAQAVSGPMLGAPWSPLQQRAGLLQRANLFRAILRNYGRTGLPIASGDILSRFRDDPVIISDALDAVCDLMGRSLFVVGAAILMWRISPLITISLLVPLLGSSFIVEALENRIVMLRHASRATSGLVSSFLGSVLAGQLALKISGAEGSAVERLQDLGHARRRAEVRDAVFAGMLDAFNNNLSAVSVGVVLLLGAPAIRSGQISIGDLALFAVFLDALGWYPEEVGRLLGGLKRIEVSMARMNAIVPLEPKSHLVRPAPVYLGVPESPEIEVPEALSRVQHGQRFERLSISGLTYTYPATGRGITDVTFAVERGSLTAITGRIGSGKSTLLQVMIGLLPIEGGEVLWNDRAIADGSAFFVPPRCSYTAQVPRLFTGTVRENILIGRTALPEQLDHAIRSAVLEQDISNLENGLATVIGARGLKLSGGQIQRTAAARMFLTNSELVIVDDLSSALDVGTEAELWQRFFSRRNRQTLIVVSHRSAVLQRADQIITLEEGRVVDVRRPG